MPDDTPIIPPDDLPADSLESYNPDRSPSSYSHTGATQGIDRSPRPAAPPQQPKRESPFELKHVIGRGGMGEVWEAVQVSLDRVVAVKRIRDDLFAGSPPAEREAMQRVFEQEALISGFLEHPNIVPVHDYGAGADGTPLLAMKRVVGKPWKDLLKPDFQNLGVEAFLARHLPTLVDVAQAVAYAHSRGVVHRDIKPAQVMVGDYGEVLLMDWGLALFIGTPGRAVTQPPDGISSLETATNPSGTPALMAPEQTEPNALRIGPWTDIYLLGGTLYYLLTGSYPHQAENSRKSFLRAVEGVIERPRDRAKGRDVPEELEALCLRALSRRKEDRFASALEFVEAIQDFLSGATRRRESMAILEAARASFGEARQPGPGDAQYQLLSAVLSDAARALELWPQNEGARELQVLALAEQAELEIAQGDLIVAQLHLRELERLRAERVVALPELRGKLAAAHQARTRAQQQRRILAGLAGILGIAVMGAVFAARQQTQRAEEAARQRSLFERANKLRQAENELALAIEREAPLPRVLEWPEEHAVPPEEEAALDALMKRRDALKQERAELVGEQVPIEAEPYSILVAEANVALLRAQEPEDAEKAFAIYSRAAAARPELPEPAMGMGIALFRAENTTSATVYLERAAELTRALKGEDSRDYADSLVLAAEAWRRLRDTQEAYRGLYQRALDVMEPEYLRMVSQLSSYYMRLDRLEESLEMTTGSLKLARRVYGADGQRYANMLDQIGVTLMQLSRLEEAAWPLHEAIRINELQQKRNEPRLAVAYNNIAGLYGNLNRFDEAEEMLLKSLEIKRRQQEPDEASIATGLNSLAGVHLARDHYAQAAALYREALAMRERALGPEHPRTVLTMAGLARALGLLGEHAEALALIERVIPVQESTFGPDHAIVASLRIQRASLLTRMGRMDEAFAEAERALPILRRDRKGRQEEGAALHFVAELKILRGDPAAGYADVLDAEDVLLAAGLRMSADYIDTMRIKAVAASDLAQWPIVRESLMEAMVVSSAILPPESCSYDEILTETPLTYFVSAERAAGAGDKESAERLWSDIVELERRIGLPRAAVRLPITVAAALGRLGRAAEAREMLANALTLEVTTGADVTALKEMGIWPDSAKGAPAE